MGCNPLVESTIFRLQKELENEAGKTMLRLENYVGTPCRLRYVLFFPGSYLHLILLFIYFVLDNICMFMLVLVLFEVLHMLSDTM